MSGMKRQIIRLLLAALVVGLTLAAAWVVTGKYDSHPDPKARFEIEAVQVKRDRGYYWLEAHLKRTGAEDHDMLQPVRLILADGRELEPADTIFAGSPEKGFTAVWFKFWLEGKDLDGAIKLLLNGGELRIKTNPESPSMNQKGEAVFKSADWRKSWLGF